MISNSRPDGAMKTLRRERLRKSTSGFERNRRAHQNTLRLYRSGKRFCIDCRTSWPTKSRMPGNKKGPRRTSLFLFLEPGRDLCHCKWPPRPQGRDDIRRAIAGCYAKNGWASAEQLRFHEMCVVGHKPLSACNDAELGKI